MKQGFRFALAFSACFAATGCAENKVKLEVARSLADNAETTTTKVATYFDEVEAQRRVAAATYVASDPSCEPTRPLKAQRRTSSARKSSSLCPRDGKVAQGYLPYDMTFGSTPNDLMKARLLMISAVGDYGRALAKILAQKSPDVSGELTSFAEKVDRVGSLLNVLGIDAPSAGDQLGSPKGKSIVALAQFVADLATEAHQVDLVVRRVKMDGGKVDDALDQLRSQVLVRAKSTATSASILNLDRLREVYRNQRDRMTFAERRALVLEIFAAEDAQELIPEKAEAIAHALAETKAAQQALRDALDNKFTPAQRRKIAAENLDRITRAMKMIADVGIAFA
jgi:hypothetical protein